MGSPETTGRSDGPLEQQPLFQQQQQQLAEQAPPIEHEHVNCRGRIADALEHAFLDILDV